MRGRSSAHQFVSRPPETLCVLTQTHSASSHRLLFENEPEFFDLFTVSRLREEDSVPVCPDFFSLRSSPAYLLFLSCTLFIFKMQIIIPLGSCTGLAVFVLFLYLIIIIRRRRWRRRRRRRTHWTFLDTRSLLTKNNTDFLAAAPADAVQNSAGWSTLDDLIKPQRETDKEFSQNANRAKLSHQSEIQGQKVWWEEAVGSTWMDRLLRIRLQSLWEDFRYQMQFFVPNHNKSGGRWPLEVGPVTGDFSPSLSLRHHRLRGRLISFMCVSGCDEDRRPCRGIFSGKLHLL